MWQPKAAATWPRRSPCIAMMRSSKTGGSAGPPVSANVAVIKTEVRLGSIDKSGKLQSTGWSPGVDRIIVWNIYEVTGGKIAVVTLVGQRTDEQTGRFIEWLRSRK